MARRRGNPLEDRIDDVVRGRERVTLEVLVELIDSVNPTGRGLTAADQRERYRLKGRLQSVLLREHGEIVVVERVDDEIVALRLEGTGRHAAHARIDGLDDDARSFVQRRLDVPEESHRDAPRGGALRPRPRGTSVPASDVAAGDAAMEAYDYEAAREHYTRAANADSSTENELRLLGLLVDVLVDDVAAIERGARAEVRLLRSSRVRALFAVAEARSGSAERARAYLEANDDTVCAVAWVELGVRAHGAGDVESARDAARRARALDAASPGLQGLELELERHVARVASQDEHELDALVASGADDEAVLAQARALLRTHPGSRRAAAEKRRIEQRQAERAGGHELTAVRASASRAETVGELELAVAALRRAARLGAEETEVAAVAARLEEARVESATRELRAQIAAATNREPPLLAWLASPMAVRERVRRERAMPVLEWLSEIDPPSGGAAARAAVRAVLDLERALDEARLGRHTTVLELIDAHAALRRVRRTVELRREAGVALLAEARRGLKDVLDAAEHGDIKIAATRWNELDRTRLTLDDEPELERAHRSITHRVGQINRSAELAQATANLELSRARALAREMLDVAADPTERELMKRRAAELEAHIMERLRVAVIEGRPEALDGRDIDPNTECASCAIDDAGRRAVVASFYGEHAFLRVLALASDASPCDVVRAVALTSPVGTIERASVLARPGHIEIAARSGVRILVSWDGVVLDVLPPPRAAVSPGVLLTTYLPDADTVWAIGADARDPTKFSVRVIDAKTGRVRRTSSGHGEYGAFTTPRGMEIWGMGERSFVRLDADAIAFGIQHTLGLGRILSLRPAVDDAGPFVLIAERDLDARSPPTLRRYASGQIRSELRLESVAGSIWSEIAPVRGGCIVRAMGERSMTRLIAVRDDGERLEIAWELDPPNVALLVDSNEIGVWMASLGTPLTMHALSLDAPPRLDGTPEPNADVAPSAGIFVGTRRPAMPVTPDSMAASARLASLDDEALASWVERSLGTADVDRVWAEALRLGARSPDLARRLFIRGAELAPDRGDLALDFAQHCLLTQRFADAVVILERVLRKRPADANARGLLAAARYGVGQIAGAQRELATALEELAPRDPARAGCTVFSAFLDEAYGPSAEVSLAGRRVLALREALELRDAGEVRAAIARIDVPWIWRPREQTAMAVVAELWAALVPTSAEEAVRRRLVLAAHRALDPQRLAPLVLPGRSYASPSFADP